jgi:hypothetical protein
VPRPSGDTEEWMRAGVILFWAQMQQRAPYATTICSYSWPEAAGKSTQSV